MGDTGERVTMNLLAADQLVDDYRRAARHFGRSSTEVSDRVLEAAMLLDRNDSVRLALESLAIDLANDADDLRWRVDYLRSTDAMLRHDTWSSGQLPTGPPALARFPAERLANMLRSSLADSNDLGQIAVLLDELSGQRHDPAYLAALFGYLGPAVTRQLARDLATSMTQQLVGESDAGGLTSTDLQQRLAESLAAASLAVEWTDHSAIEPVLTSGWFDDLLEAGGYGGDETVFISAELGHLFSAGAFRRDVAIQAGTVALALLDEDVRLSVEPKPQVIFNAEHDLHGYGPRRWEATAVELLGPAIREPSAAAELLVGHTVGGRTGAAVVADRDPSGGQDVLAPTVAELVVAGTITAEHRAFDDGLDRSALSNAWLARTTLIDEIASHVRSDTAAAPYPSVLNRAFSQMTIETMPHVMRVPPHGDSPLDVDFDPEDTTVPSADGGIHVPPETLSHLFGALFRHDQDRAALVMAAALEQRTAYVEDPSNLMLRRAGIVEGALTNGFNLARIDNAEQVVREIENANARIDSLFEGVEFAARFVPYGPQALDMTGEVDDLLDLSDIDPIEDYLHGETDGIVEAAQADARSEVHASDVRARHFVFGRAFEQMQAEFLIGGEDALSEPSRAIFDHMLTEPTLHATFRPGETTIGDLRQAGGEVWNEYDSATELLTTMEPELDDKLELFERGLDDQHGAHYTE